MKKPDLTRRNFIKFNSLAGLGLLGSAAAAGTIIPMEAAAGETAKASDLRKISKLNFAELRKRYQKALFEKFIPNMDALVIDHDLGGFMTTVDILNRKQLASTKRAWFEGRGMWMYSYLYNNLDKNPKYLEIARKSKDFILRLLPADGSYYISTFSKEGKPMMTVEGDIYGNLFVAEGLAEYAKASGERQYFDQAKDIVLKAVQRYDRPEFTYPYKAEQTQAGPRILGHWMILLSVCTQMLRQQEDAEILALADRCVDAVMKHHMNPESQVLNEALAHDFSRLSDPVAAQFGDIGHGCETLAFVMNYAVLRKDAALFKVSSKAFKRHVNIAKDQVYGGHLLALNDINTNQWSLNKARWVQEEILIGAMILIEHAGDEWAIDCYAETEAYIREKFVRAEYAFVIDSGDRKVEKYGLNRAEHYHYPRQLMMGILAIDRIEQRKGRLSGVFS